MPLGWLYTRDCPLPLPDDPGVGHRPIKASETIGSDDGAASRRRADAHICLRMTAELDGEGDIGRDFWIHEAPATLGVGKRCGEPSPPGLRSAKAAVSRGGSQPRFPAAAKRQAPLGLSAGSSRRS